MVAKRAQSLSLHHHACQWWHLDVPHLDAPQNQNHFNLYQSFSVTWVIYFVTYLTTLLCYVILRLHFYRTEILKSQTHNCCTDHISKHVLCLFPLYPNICQEVLWKSRTFAANLFLYSQQFKTCHSFFFIFIFFQYSGCFYPPLTEKLKGFKESNPIKN